MKNSLTLLIFLISIAISNSTNAKTSTKKLNHTKTHVTHEKAPKKEMKNKPIIFKPIGIASFYGKNHHGKKTASGNLFNMNILTAAHKSLPFGSKVAVTNLKTNQSITVVITDRGPFCKKRIIDLSQHAAKAIGITGIEKVSLRLISG